MTPALPSNDRDKRAVALTSLLAAVALTAMKIVVGLLTGSLGILAEAAHSGLDLIAAFVTWVAVRAAARPADHSHLYGHGKIENLSSLFETALLLGTCVWIISAAVQRLATGKVDLEVNAWSFLVMLASIAVDYSRSRALYRVATRFKSQALEADALHFQTDIWSSAVVILGLVCVKIGQVAPRFAWLENADGLAALIVAVIVIMLSMRLGLRSVQDLIDAAPRGIEARIVSAVEAVPGVNNCHRVRVRQSGGRLFADIHVLVDGGQSLWSAHGLTEQIESAVEAVAPGIDLTVHPEPEEH
jgi:cation diffusion facilitator family transporter